jgi:hypothetical protein
MFEFMVSTEHCFAVISQVRMLSFAQDIGLIPSLLAGHLPLVWFASFLVVSTRATTLQVLIRELMHE